MCEWNKEQCLHNNYRLILAHLYIVAIQLQNEFINQ
jgi:hypothetical protein